MKLILSDFDHTLYHWGHFKDEDVRAIHRFQKENRFGINTGRGYHQISETYPEGFVPPIDFDVIVADSGASLSDGKQNPIELNPIGFESVKALRESLPGVFMGFNADGYYTVFENALNPDAHGIFHTIRSLDELKDRQVTSISLRLDSPQQAHQTLEMLESLGLPVEGHVNNNYIDVSAKGISKATGLLRAARLFEIEPDQVYAIGDSWNDLPALKAAAKGFLITPDDPKLLEEARKHGLVLVDSVAQAIEQVEAL